MQPSFQGTADKTKATDHISSKRIRGETSKTSRSLCHLPPLKDRETKYMCQKCEKFLCLQHLIPLCEECVCVCVCVCARAPETEISD
jgi:hypothetical protein